MCSAFVFSFGLSSVSWAFSSFKEDFSGISVHSSKSEVQVFDKCQFCQILVEFCYVVISNTRAAPYVSPHMDRELSPPITSSAPTSKFYYVNVRLQKPSILPMASRIWHRHLPIPQSWKCPSPPPNSLE